MNVDVDGFLSGEWSRVLRRHYGIRWSARTTKRKYHGDHHFIRTFRRRYVLSRYGISAKVPDYRYQFRIMRALREAGFQLAHPPLETKSGDPAVECPGDYWILRNFTPHDGFESWHDPDVVTSSARTLATVHEAGRECEAPVIGPRDAGHALNWSVIQVIHNFDDLLDGFQQKPLTEADRRGLYSTVDSLLVNAADVLKAGEESGLTGLTHGDYRPANVLVRKRQVVNVVDWERARHDHHLHDAAFAALQFMVTCPCSCRRVGDIAATRLFMREYLAVRRIRQPEAVAWMFGFVVLRRLLLNGCTPERLRLLRALGDTRLTDPLSWK